MTALINQLRELSHEALVQEYLKLLDENRALTTHALGLASDKLALEKQLAWQPIATAPQDWNEVVTELGAMFWCPGGDHYPGDKVGWHREGSRCESSLNLLPRQPRFWFRLPPPPKERP
jgi:hypothetical protein